MATALKDVQFSSPVLNGTTANNKTTWTCSVAMFLCTNKCATCKAKNPPECRAFRRHDDAIIRAFALAGIIFALFCIALFC